MNEQELERRAQVAQLLLDAARVLGETLEPERVYERFHELLAGVIQHDGVVVSSYDADDGMIRCDYAWSDGNRLDAAALPPLPLNREGGGMQSRVIATGEPLLLNDVVEQVQQPGGTYVDVDGEGTMRKITESAPTRTNAAMMVPVKHEGRVVGVVQLMSDSGEYSTEQLDLVEGLVAQMAAAVRNARLHKERRRLEVAEAAARAVAAEREQAANVLAAVGDGIFLVDGGGIVRLWNHAGELMTGLGADTVRGRPVAEVFTDWPALEQRIPIAEDGAAARSATLPVAFGGRDMWLSFVAVRSADGVVYTFRDQTSERRLEEEKSDFIATISHELRTPVAAVYGAARTLLRPDIDLTAGQQRDLLEMIGTQAARLAQITEEVLLATQLDRGHVPIDSEPVDIGELARETMKAMRSQLPPSARLDLEIAAEAGLASGAPDRIQQVLMNLVDNAVKYGGDGPVTVTVEPGDGGVRIVVVDSGPGIPFSEQQRIFEKFYRADPKLTRAPSGTGLGLYISRELVQRMGGRLNVKSTLGAGATFVVELPRPEEPSTARVARRRRTTRRTTCSGGRSPRSGKPTPTGTPARRRTRTGCPIATPPYTEHSSGHCGLSSSFVATFQDFLGTDAIGWTDTNNGGFTRSYTHLSDAIEEIVNARVWSGIHFRTADEAGAKIGRQVAKWREHHYFKPVRHDTDDGDL